MARILIIEDCDDERESLAEFLVLAGHQVCAAHNGRAALSVLRERHVEIAITDMIMPEMDGVQTIVALRREYPDVKIIAVSGGGVISSEKYLSMARNLGANALVAKPFAPAEMLERIERLLDQE